MPRRLGDRPQLDIAAMMTHPSEQQLANILSPAIRQAIDEGHIRVSDEHALWNNYNSLRPMPKCISFIHQRN